jgi:shikimate kinase
MRIFLVGYMLCGKTTVSKKLANKLNFDFIDTDSFIENNVHYTINDIFEKFSQDVFRKIEHNTLLDIIKKDNIIVSTGGGMPCFNDNMQIIKENGISIYLQMNANEIFSRLKLSKHPRPLLKNLKEDEILSFIENDIKERERFYLQSNIITSGLSFNIEDILIKIKEFQ